MSDRESDFAAFLSYDRDESRICDRVHRALETLGRPFFQLRGRKVFRDVRNLAAGESLRKMLTSALQKSTHFVFLASPNSAASDWGKFEVESWLARHGQRSTRFLIVLCDGDIVWDTGKGDFDWTRTTALPDVLRGSFDEEPAYCDLRGIIATGGRLSLFNSAFRDRIAEVVATLDGRDKADIVGRHLRVRRQLVISIALIALLIVGTAGWGVAQARDGARRASEALVTAAEIALRDGYDDRALRLAVLAARGGVLSPAAADADVQLARVAHAAKHLATFPADAPVLSSQFSPDGTRIATVGEDKIVRVWDLSGAETPLVFPHDDYIWATVFSPDGKSLVTASADASVQVWNVMTGARITTLPRATPSPAPIFSDDGTVLLTGGRLWDAATWNIKQAHELDDSPLAARFDADAKRILTSTRSTTLVWERETGKEIARIPHSSPLNDAVLSRDSRYIATTSFDNKVRVWDVRTRRVLREMAHDAPVRRAALSPDGAWLVTGSDDKTTRAWRVESGQQAARLDHEWPVYCAPVFDSLGRYALTFGGKIAGLWKTGAPGWMRLPHDGQVECGHFSADGRHALTASDDGLARMWEAGTGTLVARFRHDGPVRSAIFSPDGSRVLTIFGKPETLRLWSAGEPLGQQVDHEDGEVDSAVFSEDGRRVLTTARHGSVKVWDVGSGRELITLPNLRSPLLSADGRHVVGIDAEKSAVMWDVDSRGVRRLDHEGGVSFALFSPDGQRVLTASTGNSTVLLRDRQSAARVASWQPGPTEEAIFSRDGRYVLTVSSEQDVVYVRDLVDGRTLPALEIGGSLADAAFSPDGARVVTTAVSKKGALLWSLDAPQRPVTIAPAEDVRLGEFSQDGRRLLMMTDAGARIWDLDTALAIATLPRRGLADFHSARFSTDDRHVLTAAGDGTVRVWDATSARELADSRHGVNNWMATFSADRRRVHISYFDIAADLNRVTFFTAWDIHWLIERRGDALVDAVCREKLAGARTLTGLDIASAGVLVGREREDVCGPRSLWWRLEAWFRDF